MTERRSESAERETPRPGSRNRTTRRARDHSDRDGPTQTRHRSESLQSAIQAVHGNTAIQQMAQRLVAPAGAESRDASPAEREASRIGAAVRDIASRDGERSKKDPRTEPPGRSTGTSIVRRRPDATDSAEPPAEDREFDPERSGRRLPADTRGFFEGLYGESLSSVTVHTDAAAADRAAVLNARAYTYGDDVVFGRNRYDPESAEGLGLLAHELAHVVQQRHGQRTIARQSDGDLETAAQARDRRLGGVLAEIDRIGEHVDGNRLDDDLREDVAALIREGVRRRNLDLTPESTMRTIARRLGANFHPDDAGAILGELEEFRGEMQSRGTESALESIQTPSARTGLGPVYGPGASGPFPMSAIAGQAIDQTEGGGAFFDAARYAAGQTTAFLEGLASGWASGIEGTINMILHPIETLEGMAQLVIHYDETADAIGDLLEDYIDAAHTDPQEFARMTGQLVGEIHVALVTPSKVLKGRDVAGAVGTAGVTTGRFFGIDTSLWHYTNRAGREGIDSTARGGNATLRAGANSGGVFATPLHPALGGSNSLAGFIAREALGLSRLDFFSRIGGKLRFARMKDPFTDAVRFMSPEFKILFKTNLESSLSRAVKSVGLQFGANGDQVVRVLAMEALADPVAMERLLNGMGYVVTSGGIVVHESETETENGAGDGRSSVE